MDRPNLIVGDARKESPSDFLKRAFPERHAEVEWQKEHRAKCGEAKTPQETGDLWLEGIAHSLGMPFDELKARCRGQWL